MLPSCPGDRIRPFLALLFVCLAAGVLCATASASEAQRPPAHTGEPCRVDVEGGECAPPRQAASGWERWERVGRMGLPDQTLSVNLPARWAIVFFQRFVSPVDGPSCEFTPSCSAYGLQAIRKHGLLLGIPMAAERIVRNHHPDNPLRYPLVERQGAFYYLDPVESNDFWWAGGP